jgi:sec-independent protein translocase protein TatA
MNVFGVGPTELFVVLIVILVLFGPDKLPELAKRIGGASRELRGSLDNITEQMDEALKLSMEQDKARMTPPAGTQVVDSSAKPVDTPIVQPAAIPETAPTAPPANPIANMTMAERTRRAVNENNAPSESSILEEETPRAFISEANPPPPAPES